MFSTKREVCFKHGDLDQHILTSGYTDLESITMDFIPSNVELQIVREVLNRPKNLKTLSIHRSNHRALFSDMNWECLETLATLLAFDCVIPVFPVSVCSMKSLTELCMVRCTFESLPDCIGEMKTLEKLSLQGCKKIKKIPDSVSGLQSLKTLILLGCAMINSLPESMRMLRLLEYIDIRDTALCPDPRISRLSPGPPLTIPIKWDTETVRSHLQFNMVHAYENDLCIKECAILIVHKIPPELIELARYYLKQ